MGAPSHDIGFGVADGSAEARKAYRRVAVEPEPSSSPAAGRVALTPGQVAGGSLDDHARERAGEALSGRA
jgi:hypothetical protein